MPDLFDTAPRQTPRGHIDNTIGQGNGRFLGHVANGMARAELERRFRAGEYPDLNADIARNAMGTTHHQERRSA